MQVDLRVPVFAVHLCSCTGWALNLTRGQVGDKRPPEKVQARRKSRRGIRQGSSNCVRSVQPCSIIGCSTTKGPRKETAVDRVHVHVHIILVVRVRRAISRPHLVVDRGRRSGGNGSESRVYLRPVCSIHDHNDYCTTPTGSPLNTQMEPEVKQLVEMVRFRHLAGHNPAPNLS